MTLMQIITLASDLTGHNELSEKLETNVELDESEQEVCDLLIKCFNLVQSEVASEYIPLLKNQTLTTENFRINLGDFLKFPLDIISVKDRLGRNVKYRKYDDHIVARANKCEVTYSYHPVAVTDLESEVLEALLPIRVYGYGIAREYFLIQSLTEEAALWEIRFKDSLKILTRKKSEIMIPRRGWL